MMFTCKVGGARKAFAEPHSAAISCALDNAFGPDQNWEEAASREFGEMAESGLVKLQDLAIKELGVESVTNLLAMGSDGRCVYLPAYVRTISLPFAAGKSLRCASLPGLRRELGELAARQGFPIDDDSLRDLLNGVEDSDDQFSAPVSGVAAYARLALAANEAVRKDCPLWLVGGLD